MAVNQAPAINNHAAAASMDTIMDSSTSHSLTSGKDIPTNATNTSRSASNSQIKFPEISQVQGKTILSTIVPPTAPWPL